MSLLIHLLVHFFLHRFMMLIRYVVLGIDLMAARGADCSISLIP